MVWLVRLETRLGFGWVNKSAGAGAGIKLDSGVTMPCPAPGCWTGPGEQMSWVSRRGGEGEREREKAGMGLVDCLLSSTRF